MSSPFPNPFQGNAFQQRPSNPDATLDLRVTNEQRQRVLDYLGDALADGRINMSEFEKRSDDAIAAKTRRDLNQSLSGLATVPLVSAAVRPARSPLAKTEPSSGGSAAAGLIGLSPFVAGPVGPLIGVAATEKGSWTRKQVANQANAQIYMIAIAIVLSAVVGSSIISGLAWFAWAGLTLVQAIRAFQGESWRNPLTRVIPFQIVNEGPAEPKSLGRGRR
ncbi:DUF1707 and DUF4870 domain-containing protein [Acidipropionibacterium acidipropionici]|uniref:DUF1707 and DUF4870 domain-containing protein n=1 Tax=Acidipropionibacterium acidipropionici TaxID=1748 RepID=UPI0004037C8D|nr:DUF1707 and DUF4870 domain-containing protein [Acidipropionibacterium acidipropionici]ALN15823.1 hypothetical protein ASQ49_11745 [Acidipropionibacterium acidipropionici]